MSAVIQGPAAAGTLTGLARALVQQGKLRPDRAENFARKALQSTLLTYDQRRGYRGPIKQIPTTPDWGVPLADIPPGTYVCVKTNQGRISQFRVNGFMGTTMKLGYTTWAN